jgi:AraC-like DNA-binding protein
MAPFACLPSSEPSRMRSHGAMATRDSLVTRSEDFQNQRATASLHRVMSISILLVRGTVEAVIAAGVSREELLDAAHFELARLDDIDGRVGGEELDRVQAAALDLTGDLALGLHLGERASAAAYDMVAYLTSQATTLREGIESFLRFERILSDAPGSELEEGEDVATLKKGLLHSDPRCTRLRAEMSMTGFTRLIQHFVGPKGTPRRVFFEHPAPSYRAEYARIFGGTERFEHAFTGIEFDRTLLDREQLHKNAELHAILTTEAERKLNRLTRRMSHAERLREYLIATAPQERPDMTSVARGLGMSVRSLRRRLSEEGVSYAGLVEEAQASVAKRLLDDPGRSIYETAYDMGFSDPSAFHRAFKRWTGITPKQYRGQR